ncbi:MAG TPA: NAD kinase [Bacteroidales bacterium]|nr:NAD kinase [Bacteroidales bacterium]
MKVALFGKSFDPRDALYIRELADKLAALGGQLLVYEPFYHALKDSVQFPVRPSLFTDQEGIRGNADYCFSIGGDGTLLGTVPLVGNSGIPIMGINMGRLGFLSGISKEEILPALEQIAAMDFVLDSRTLLRLESPDHLFSGYNYALNDITVFKNSPFSMLKIRTTVNDDYLNTYWADGLIVATPTGSTAYSLSCTGPIVTPDSENFVITPIASHNLTVRPIVIRDDSIIRIVVESTETGYSVGMDSRVEKLERSVELVIKKEDFRINLLRLPGRNFLKTIRKKLNWGLDIRN